MRHHNPHEGGRPESRSVVQVTREGPLDRAFMAKVYAWLPADARLRTADQLKASIESILSRYDGDAAVHVFGS
jgi:hypothetical protein